MITAGSAVATLVFELNARNPRRTVTLNQINLRLAELSARKAFHQDPTESNLTAWCDAHEALEAAS